MNTSELVSYLIIVCLFHLEADRSVVSHLVIGIFCVKSDLTSFSLKLNFVLMSGW
jgi:hypothetical protein